MKVSKPLLVALVLYLVLLLGAYSQAASWQRAGTKQVEQMATLNQQQQADETHNSELQTRLGSRAGLERAIGQIRLALRLSQPLPARCVVEHSDEARWWKLSCTVEIESVSAENTYRLKADATRTEIDGQTMSSTTTLLVLVTPDSVEILEQ